MEIERWLEAHSTANSGPQGWAHPGGYELHSHPDCIEMIEPLLQGGTHAGFRCGYRVHESNGVVFAAVIGMIPLVLKLPAQARVAGPLSLDPWDELGEPWFCFDLRNEGHGRALYRLQKPDYWLGAEEEAHLRKLYASAAHAAAPDLPIP